MGWYEASKLLAGRRGVDFLLEGAGDSNAWWQKLPFRYTEDGLPFSLPFPRFIRPTASSHSGPLFPHPLGEKSCKSFPIFYKMLKGFSVTLIVKGSMDIYALKLLHQAKTRILTKAQRMQHEGKILDSVSYMSEYKIKRDYIIFLNARLCSGSRGRGNPSLAKPTYKEMAQQNKGPIVTSRAYIVDRADQTPQLELTNPYIVGIHDTYPTRGIIYRFNGLWPKTADLFKWIFSNWTNDCEIFLCSRGFFMVLFKCQEDYQGLFYLGPWL